MPHRGQKGWRNVSRIVDGLFGSRLCVAEQLFSLWNSLLNVKFLQHVLLLPLFEWLHFNYHYCHLQVDQRCRLEKEGNCLVPVPWMKQKKSFRAVTHLKLASKKPGSLLTLLMLLFSILHAWCTSVTKCFWSHITACTFPLT